MNWLSDEEIVQRLGSRDSRESREAAEEVMNRGERVIPLLLKNRGDNRPYAWGSLGHPKSGAITFGPTNDETWDEGRIITVEAASIYIICALFYGNLDFGSSAYLRDSTPVEFNKYNTRARMERAWESVEIWFGQLQKESLESLRRRNDGPLSASGFHF